MENFDERKEEYLNTLRNNIDLVSQIVDNNPKLQVFWLDPKNEKELSLAESIMTFMIDSADITNRIYSAFVSEEEIENSVSIDLFVKIINSFKKDDKETIEKIKDELKCSMDPKNAAELLFDFAVVFASDIERSVEEIAKRTGFDLNDDLFRMQFYKYLALANEITNSKSFVNAESISEEDEKLINSTITLSSEFHKLYVERFKTKYNERTLKQ